MTPGVSEDVIKEVMAAEAARKASGGAASSSIDEQLSEQTVSALL